MKDNNDNNMSEQDVNEERTNEQQKRRKAVKNLLMAGGSAVTAAQLGNSGWSKPVIESVVLPAHATTSGLGFSITDPVSLQYSCDNRDVDIDITGYISEPIAGIRVRLELTWSHSGADTTPSETPPRIFNVVTDSNGIYASLNNNIGFSINEVSVIASLPDYPDAGTDSDTIYPNDEFGGSGGANETYYIATYCAPPTTPSP